MFQNSCMVFLVSLCSIVYLATHVLVDRPFGFPTFHHQKWCVALSTCQFARVSTSLGKIPSSGIVRAGGLFMYCLDTSLPLIKAVFSHKGFWSSESVGGQTGITSHWGLALRLDSMRTVTFPRHCTHWLLCVPSFTALGPSLWVPQSPLEPSR